MTIQVEKRYFKVNDYRRMGEAGVFSEDDRVELVEGEIVEMTPIGRRHAACVDRLTELLSEQPGVIVRVQNPVQLDVYTEVQPDVTLLKRREDFYSRSHPTPEDVLLAVEVADTSAAYDREVKLPLYARSGVPEVWLVDLNASIIEVYATPEGGAYRESLRVAPGETLTASEVSSSSPVAVRDVLG